MSRERLTSSVLSSLLHHTPSPGQKPLDGVQMKRVNSPEELARCRTPLPPLLLRHTALTPPLHAVLPHPTGTQWADCWELIIVPQRLISVYLG